MQKIALWGPSILIGVWGATLSSAIGSILGAPRVLQALARDGVLPRWLRVLGTGSGPNDEPRIGTMFTRGQADNQQPGLVITKAWHWLIVILGAFGFNLIEQGWHAWTLATAG